MGNTFKLGNYVNGIFQDASNNIGIGGSPSGSYKLEVTGTAKVSSTLLLGGALTGTSATFSGANYIFTLNGGGTTRIAGTIANTSGGMDFGLEGALGNQLFTGVSSYEGGIGTNNARAFHIATNGTSRLSIALTGAATFSSSVSANILNSTSAGSTQIFLKSTGGGSNRDWQFQTNESAAGDISLMQSTTAGGAVYATKLNITSGGNVLVGTTTDSGYRLNVNGTIRATSPIRASNAGNTIYTELQTDGLYTTGSDMYLYTDTNLRFFTTSERMRITSAGELCLNATAAQGAGLFYLQGLTNSYNLIAIKDTGTTYSSTNSNAILKSRAPWLRVEQVWR